MLCSKLSNPRRPQRYILCSRAKRKCGETAGLHAASRLTMAVVSRRRRCASGASSLERANESRKAGGKRVSPFQGGECSPCVSWFLSTSSRIPSAFSVSAECLTYHCMLRRSSSLVMRATASFPFVSSSSDRHPGRCCHSNLATLTTG